MKHFSKGVPLQKPGLAAPPKLPEFFLSAAKVHNVPAASWKGVKRLDADQIKRA